MKKFIFFVIFILVVVGLVLAIDQKWFMKKEKPKGRLAPSEIEGPVREPAVAGAFYPSDKAELDSMIDEFLNKVELPKLDPYIRALIVPHAGYVYSGQVAAYGYKALIGKEISRVIIIGNSHQEFFDGASIYPRGYFETPLGKVKIDEDFAKKLMDADPKIYFKESAHLEEHSLEVQIPFLQKTLPALGWKIVPIILGNQPGTADILINALKNLIDDNTLIIASSDLSHYPNYKDAQYSDNKVIQAILSGKREDLRETISQLESEDIPNLQTCACGHDAIEVVMGLMSIETRGLGPLGEDKTAKLLKYANSGDVSGDKSRVVGYGAIIFTSDKSETELNKEQQKRLLEIARQSLETYLKEGKLLRFEEDDPLLNKPMGAFVTLKEHGELRGCIGVFPAEGGSASGGELPLYQVVAETVISSAINDPRFMPVTKEEIPLLEYEISVLNPLKKVNSYKDVEIGKHGVKIVKGSRSGVFLPQVATENNWDRDAFLSILCTQKAGLSADCWKDEDTEIYVFTAQVFDEEDVK
ncbi:MAG: AmmeMemoRadiSam system protein B [Patescibacteria group bacterium]